MPTVTKIARQQRNGERFSIYTDDKYAFSLDGLDLSASDLRVGTELSDADIETWRQRSDEGKAYNKALGYISIRLRSEFEVRRYLVGKDYAVEAVEAIIERLHDLKLLDDRTFAAAWIRDRRLLRPRSKQALKFELAKHGVARDIIDEALAEDETDEVTALATLITRKTRQYPDRDKLMAYLARQGYRYDDIKAALRQLED